MIAKLRAISGIRWIRMGIGLFFIFTGIGDKRWGVSLLGAIIFLQGLMDWGCGFGKVSCGPTLTQDYYDHIKFDARKSIKPLDKHYGKNPN